MKEKKKLEISSGKYQTPKLLSLALNCYKLVELNEFNSSLKRLKKVLVENAACFHVSSKVFAEFQHDV